MKVCRVVQNCTQLVPAHAWYHCLERAYSAHRRDLIPDINPYTFTSPPPPSPPPIVDNLSWQRSRPLMCPTRMTPKIGDSSRVYVCNRSIDFLPSCDRCRTPRPPNPIGVALCDHGRYQRPFAHVDFAPPSVFWNEQPSDTESLNRHHALC